MATRIERVVLELDDNLTTGMARAAAATALLKRELGDLDGETVKAGNSQRELGNNMDRTNRSARDGNAELNSYAGRIRLIAELALGLGPALIPIGAVAIPALAGVANSLLAVSLGAGTAVLAFNGLGDAVAKINKYAVDPTAANLKNMQIAMENLAPSARKFAHELAAMHPEMDRLREAAGQGLFPGLESALQDLGTRSHQVEKILFRLGSVLGHLSKDAGKALAGPEWDDFFKFVADEAPAALEGFGRATGKVIHGLAELWMAFAPLNHDFTSVILDAANGFDQWATGLSKTQGFHDFIDYLRTNGPLVADAVVAIGNAVLKIVEAAAPLGGPILQALTAVADAISTVADSDAGPAILATVTALSLLSRATSLFGKVAQSSYGQAIRGVQGVDKATQQAARSSTASAALQARAARQVAGAGEAQSKAFKQTAIRGGLAAAGLGLAMTGVADKTGLANTATLALTGSLAGPWGAAAGAAVGLLLDMHDETAKVDIDQQALTETLNQQTGAITKNTQSYVAGQLEKGGFLQNARDMGINLHLVTLAATGNTGALKELNAETEKYVNLTEIGAASKGGAQETLTDTAVKARGLRDAVGDTNEKLKDSQGELGRTNDALGGTHSSFDKATTAAESFRLEVSRVNDLLEHRASLRSFQQDLDDFAKRAEDRGKIMVQIAQAQRDLVDAKTPKEKAAARARIADLQQQAADLKYSFDIHEQAGRDTQALFDQTAKDALASADKMKKADRADFLQNARKNLVDMAIKAGKSREAAEKLADKLGLLDQYKVNPKITVDGTEKANAQLRLVQSNLAAIRSKTIKLTTVRATGGRVLVDPTNADGGTIGGARTPYGDKVLSWVAPGEEVISNRYGQADQHRSLLKAINSRRYAEGGSVAASRVNVNVAAASAPAGGIDYDRMAGAVAAVRPAPPLYGDVHVTDGYGGFRRQMERDRAMAALSGVRR